MNKHGIIFSLDLIVACMIMLFILFLGLFAMNDLVHAYALELKEFNSKQKLMFAADSIVGELSEKGFVAKGMDKIYIEIKQGNKRISLHDCKISGLTVERLLIINGIKTYLWVGLCED